MGPKHREPIPSCEMRNLAFFCNEESSTLQLTQPEVLKRIQEDRRGIAPAALYCSKLDGQELLVGRSGGMHWHLSPSC